MERVEHFNFFTKRKIDLLGVGDLLALNGKEMLFVQVTSRANVSTRRHKADESDKLKLWLKAGGKFLILGLDKIADNNRWRIAEFAY